jgi:hypothetical protein
MIDRKFQKPFLMNENFLRKIDTGIVRRYRSEIKDRYPTNHYESLSFQPVVCHVTPQGQATPFAEA